MKAIPGGGADGTSAPIDLTGIDPVNWPRTRERVAVLREWCASPKHTRAQTEAAAKSIDVTVGYLYRLASIWRKHGDARLISGQSTPRGRRQAPKTMDTRTRRMLDLVIDRMGPRSRHTDVVAEVMKGCDAAGIPRPSPGTVHYALMHLRRSASAADDGDACIVVASVICMLPVAVGGSVVGSPDLVLAVNRSSGHILDHRLVLDGEKVDAARDMLSRLATTTDGPVLVASNFADAVADASGGIQARVDVARGLGLLTTVLGGFIDSIPIRHRKHRSRKDGRRSPIDPGDATIAVDLAVRAQNAGRPT